MASEHVMAREPENGKHKKRGLIARLWDVIKRPSARYSVGALVIVGFVAGILFWGGYNWAMALSNTETFCISCHSMKDNSFEELKQTIHYKNRTGVRAICSDCHVPKEWVHKFVRKIKATKDLYHEMLGTIDTPEKFKARRLIMAKKVWREMKDADSRECRNCHSFTAMDPEVQSRIARKKHIKATKKGLTCIDCHQGIAHNLPNGWKKAWKEEFGT